MVMCIIMCACEHVCVCRSTCACEYVSMNAFVFVYVCVCVCVLIGDSERYIDKLSSCVSVYTCVRLFLSVNKCTHACKCIKLSLSVCVSLRIVFQPNNIKISLHKNSLKFVNTVPLLIYDCLIEFLFFNCCAAIIYCL